MNCGKNNISQAFYDRQLKVETNQDTIQSYFYACYTQIDK